VVTWTICAAIIRSTRAVWSTFVDIDTFVSVCVINKPFRRNTFVWSGSILTFAILTNVSNFLTFVNVITVWPDVSATTRVLWLSGTFLTRFAPCSSNGCATEFLFFWLSQIWKRWWKSKTNYWERWLFFGKFDKK